MKRADGFRSHIFAAIVCSCLRGVYADTLWFDRLLTLRCVLFFDKVCDDGSQCLPNLYPC